MFGETENAYSIRAFDMQPGEITKPYKHDNGWVIIKLHRFEEPRMKTFDECGLSFQVNSGV